MLAPTSLPVGSMRKISFTWVWDVENPGVGIVERNTVLFTMILKRGNDVTMQKITTMLFVAVKKLDLRKKTTARVDTQDIVQSDGNEPMTTIECLPSLKKLQKPLFLYRL
jgi:hypothetical protein